MPYFVFRSFPEADGKKPELEQQHDAYKSAKQQVAELREENPDVDLNYFKMVFAEDEKKARILLRTHREPPRIEEWEK